ncbi:sensor histidine kinase [Nocardiopsis xinjiangensis]|uniref:sensor histidine kinase n=1 Tax=Nocardiopsis xinjiangensis TaxID=124285 RepID=UPI000348DD9A|nr:sensor histidine kinase [Nocardiopsis xinjiangensis]
MRESGERHAWELTRGWDIYFTSVVLILLALSLLTSEPGARSWWAAGLVASLLPLYWLAGRRIIVEDRYASGESLVFGLVVAAVCSAAIFLDSGLGFLLLALAPLCFMTGGSAYGTLSVGVILIVPWALRGIIDGDPALSLLANLLSNAVVLAFAYWFGRWCERVIEQSWERAELIGELRESRAEAARLSEQAGAMAEREHLAREMHDTLAQGFTSIVALTQAVESELETDPATARRHLALTRETALDNLAETRAMVAARGPVLLEDDDLEEALERLTGRFGAELGLAAEAEVRGRARPLPGDVQVCLLRTAQEALANVRKHAGPEAESARVRLSYTDVGVSLSVRDDGRGFDPDRPGHGNGIANMRRRAHDLGGVLDVESAPGDGTTVRLALVAEGSEEEPRVPDGDRQKTETP